MVTANSPLRSGWQSLGCDWRSRDKNSWVGQT